MRKIAVLGGTGPFGRGLAARFSFNYEVLLGSRDTNKAMVVAKALEGLTENNIRGLSNIEAAERCDIAILALPSPLSDSFVSELELPLEEKLVISPMVPMTFRNGLFEYSPVDGSAAERLAKQLPKSRVAAALHTIPARELLKVRKELDYDVFVAAGDEKLFRESASIVKKIKNLRSLYVGPLASARYVESLTPLLLNISRLNEMKDPSLKVV
jgi:NADPH-dependent F420 reductase